MTGGWWIGMLLNAVIGAAFLAVGVILAARLTLKREWQANPLATAFTLVALTCGAGHFGRALILLAPSVGFASLTGLAARVEFSDWHMWVADGVTAIAGVFYLTARFRSPELLWTAKVFDDLQERRTRALVLHDEVVQDLAEAKLALNLGHREQGLQALRRGLATSKQVISGDIHDGPVRLEGTETRRQVHEGEA